MSMGQYAVKAIRSAGLIRRQCVFLLLIGTLLSCFPASSDVPVIADRGEAERLLSELPLNEIEGIWEYPADEVAVMVVRDESAKGRYAICLVESVDCRLYPGQRLGWIEESPDVRKFRISLCSVLNPGGIPGQFKEGMAILSDRGDVLQIEMPKLKLTFNPSIVFPAFWNKLRLNLRVKSTDPLERLPEGWVKTFPTETLIPRNPVYL